VPISVLPTVLGVVYVVNGWLVDAMGAGQTGAGATISDLPSCLPGAQLAERAAAYAPHSSAALTRRRHSTSICSFPTLAPDKNW